MTADRPSTPPAVDDPSSSAAKSLVSGHARPQASAADGEGDAPLLEHEYDGIREYDNPLPRWWVSTFWVTFLFAAAYFFHYQVSGRGTSIHEAYAQDVKEHEAAMARRAASEKVTEDSLERLMATETAVLAGHQIFQSRCQPCHGDRGQGLIGPNLTDDYWVHGQGKLMDIYQVVHDGVAAKGMPAWSRQLSPMELRQVVVHVGKLRGTNVAGKAPEGQLVSGGAPSEKAPVSEGKAPAGEPTAAAAGNQEADSAATVKAVDSAASP